MAFNFAAADQAASYITRIYKVFDNPDLVYHNISHVQNVIARINEIIAACELTEAEKVITLVAGWFHDCGHLFGSAYGHEVKSAGIMAEYMEMLKVDKRVIELIARCILTTGLDETPFSMPEKILCDADLFHFGTTEFKEQDKLVKKEFERRNEFTPANWDELTLELLKTHRFHTPYCQTHLEAGKQLNIRDLEAKIKYNTTN